MERAREIVTDISYFGTMMVHLGLADGMVSGAVNTTAHTIRPALEFVKTKPGVSTVSSVFLMCLADRVLVYGDCAVIPEPTTEQLADIAISSAETAPAVRHRAARGDAVVLDRHVRIGCRRGEGAGRDGAGGAARSRICCWRVRSNTTQRSIRRWRGPSCRTQPVAGRATVFIFPDLNTGNNTYKAVQRSAHAIAIGPVLQGLRKPVNDLSRGALVSDIVNTVAITAVQAQAIKQADSPRKQQQLGVRHERDTRVGPERRLLVTEVSARGARDRRGPGQGNHRADRRGG